MTIRSGNTGGSAGDQPGWRFNLVEGNENFWPVVGVHEGRTVIALLDQGMVGGAYDEDDVIHPPSLIMGTIWSDLLDVTEEAGPIHGWVIRTIDGGYDLGSVIVCWKWAE